MNAEVNNREKYTPLKNNKVNLDLKNWSKKELSLLPKILYVISSQIENMGHKFYIKAVRSKRSVSENSKKWN